MHGAKVNTCARVALSALVFLPQYDSTIAP
jgi:hypothetical protein